jgi:hypothetical protein
VLGVGSRVEDAWLTFSQCHITSNLGSGAVIGVSDATSVQSVATDWGEGELDNTASDLSGWSRSWDDLGASETFVCDLDGCLGI